MNHIVRRFGERRTVVGPDGGVCSIAPNDAAIITGSHLTEPNSSVRLHNRSACTPIKHFVGTEQTFPFSFVPHPEYLKL